jgi:hypothetical protein
VDAKCTIRDAQGAEVTVGYVTRTPSGLSISYGALGDDGLSSVDPALAPGSYEIRLEHERYLAKGVEVEVKSGESQDIEVPMELKR